MKVGVLIFARYDSSRLPGKALIDINGRKLLGRVIDRSKNLSNACGVVVATSDRATDDAIADFSIAQGVDVFRGQVDDVATRAIDACRSFGWDAFARVCGDRPFYDTSIVDFAIGCMINEKRDLVTTDGKYPLPPGLTTEVVLLEALERGQPNFSTFHREHLTSYLYENPEKFLIKQIEYPLISRQRYPTTLVVDTQLDLKRASWISKKLQESAAERNLSTEQLLGLALSWDQLFLNN